jgi:hypothetical protein
MNTTPAIIGLCPECNRLLTEACDAAQEYAEAVSAISQIAGTGKTDEFLAGAPDVENCHSTGKRAWHSYRKHVEQHGAEGTFVTVRDFSPHNEIENTLKYSGRTGYR